MIISSFPTLGEDEVTADTIEGRYLRIIRLLNQYIDVEQHNSTTEGLKLLVENGGNVKVNM